MIVAAGAAAALVLVRRGGDPVAPKEPAAADAPVRFEEVARDHGLDFHMAYLPNEQGENFKINLYDHGTGVAVADVDGDGDDDVYLCNQLDRNALYLNDGKARFTDATARAGVGMPDVISVAATFADVDSDGDPDLYVTTTRGGNVLFKNRGDGTFEDVTKQAGLVLVAHSEQGTFFDADADGDLDLLVTNTAHWTTDRFDEHAKYFVGPGTLWQLLDSPKEENVFYVNDGRGVFGDATKQAGLAGAGWGGDVAALDYDGDGDLDLFVANMFGGCVLYENDGHGRFRNGTAQALGRTPWGAVGAKSFDYDGDGLLDLFVVDMHSDMWMDEHLDTDSIPHTRKYSGPCGGLIEQKRLGLADEEVFLVKTGSRREDVFFGNGLYRNLGAGRFEEVSDRAGVETLWPWGIASGDFDGDGDEDAFLPSGMGSPFAYVHSPLLLNRGDGTFEDVAGPAGLDPPPGGRLLVGRVEGKPLTRSSRAAATGDFDGDGRLDLVVSTFNDRAFLYLNRSPKRHFVAMRLTGTKSNRDAIGALVKLTVGGRVLVRQVDAAGGYLAQSSSTLHFGLGDATKIDRCEIRWPSGHVQILEDLAVDARRDVREPPP